jgi:RimJ/RimL family protein N-acetyltransferase
MPFDTQPILTGRLLELRPLRAEDFDALYAVAADPLLWEQHPQSNRHERPVFEAFFAEAIASRGALAVGDVRDGRVIGSSRYFGHDEATGEIEIGWTFLARSHWGGTYNRELKDLMLRHAFRFVTRVLFLVGPNNHRSRRALEKIGAVQHGTRTTADGRESIVYRIDAADWGG